MLATTWPKMLLTTTFLPAAPAIVTLPSPAITVTSDVAISSLSVAISSAEPFSMLKIRALSPPVFASSNSDSSGSDNTKQLFWFFNHAAFDGAMSLLPLLDSIKNARSSSTSLAALAGSM